MMEVTCATITTLGAIACTILTVCSSAVTKKNKRLRARDESRAHQRAKESLLALKMSNANGELTLAIAVAIKRGYANGEIEAATLKLSDAQHEYKQFLEGIGLEQITK